MPSDRDFDRSLAKAARGAIARSPLDITELMITSKGGMVEISGKVKRPRGYSAATMNVRKELENIKMMVRAVAGVKEVFAERVQVYD